MFGGSESQLFWPLLSRLAPPITVSSVQDMENITSEIGRVSKPILLTTSDNSPPPPQSFFMDTSFCPIG